MIDKKYEYVICNSPAILSLDELEKFRGQSSPEVPRITLDASALDQTLLNALLLRWKQRYCVKEPTWSDRALFRSLNMAYQASRLPGSQDVTIYDVGRSIALWVSAFEILAHPSTGDSGLTAVSDLLNSVKWIRSDSKTPSFDCYASRRGRTVKGNMARWLYGEIYHARNDFLHGNPIASDRLEIAASGRHLLQYAAPLFRLALTAFLDLRFNLTPPPIARAKAFGTFIARSMNFEQYQRVIEDAVMLAHKRPKGDED